MPRDGSPLPDLAEWHAQNARMIAFPVIPPFGVEQDWWRDVTGGRPEQSIRKTQKQQEQGVYDGRALSLEVDPFRVTWTVSPHVDPDDLRDIPSLGPFVHNRESVLDAMVRWLEQCPPLKRLSFAAALLQFVDSKDEAYRRLDAYLNGVTVGPETTDFMYRVNRIKDSQAIPGLRINRLCTWQAVKLSFGINARASTGEVAEFPIQQDRHACLLELDINTVPEGVQELPRDSLTAIFAELVDIGLHTAAGGDV